MEEHVRKVLYHQCQFKYCKGSGVEVDDQNEGAGGGWWKKG